MSNIGALIGMAGLFGMPVCLILAIRSLIKKQPSKKFWLAIPVCFLMFFAGGLLSSNKEPQPSQPAQIAAATTEPTTAATTAPTTEATTEPTTEATTEVTTEPTTAETEPPELTVESLIEIVEIYYSQILDDFKVTADGNVITLEFAEDGFAAVCYSASQGNAEMQKTWSEFVDTMKESCKETSTTTLKHHYSFRINVLNDQNKENVILSIVDGYVYINAADT